MNKPKLVWFVTQSGGVIGPLDHDKRHLVKMATEHATELEACQAAYGILRGAEANAEAMAARLRTEMIAIHKRLEALRANEVRGE